MFFVGITLLFLLFILVVFFGTFFYKPGNVQQALTFNKPKVNIDMSIFDSDQFKNLQPIPEMELQYAYTVATKNGKQKTGFISATSSDEATKMLEGVGLTVYSLKEVQVGRDDPFSPYSSALISPSPSPSPSKAATK